MCRSSSWMQIGSLMNRELVMQLIKLKKHRRKGSVENEITVIGPNLNFLGIGRKIYGTQDYQYLLLNPLNRQKAKRPG